MRVEGEVPPLPVLVQIVPMEDFMTEGVRQVAEEAVVVEEVVVAKEIITEGNTRKTPLLQVMKHPLLQIPTVSGAVIRIRIMVRMQIMQVAAMVPILPIMKALLVVLITATEAMKVRK